MSEGKTRFSMSEGWFPMQTLGDRQASMGVTPSPPISGRGSSALAAVRRRSWSGRASSLGHPDGAPGAGPFGSGALPGEGSSGGTAGGPSSGSSLMMTRQDSLGSSLLSSSTPRHYGFHAAPLAGAYASPGEHVLPVPYLRPDPDALLS